MKRTFVIPIVFVLVILVITLSGCKKKDGGSKEPVKDAMKSTEDLGKDNVNKEAIMKEFENMIKNRNESDKIVAFIGENIGKLSQIEGDKMISDLEIILEDSLDLSTDKLFEVDVNGELMNIAGTELFFPENKVKDIQDEKLREQVTKLFGSKYKLINLEVSFYPIVDYEKLKQYNNYISDELKDYIAIKAMDSKEPVAVDGGLIISYDDLAARIISAENYIQKYSEGQRYEEMLGYYRNKLDLYLRGLDNTPIADYQTNKIYKDVFDSYKKTSNVKDSVTAFVVNKYVNLIEENKLIVDENVKDKVLSLVNEALSLLETSK